MIKKKHKTIINVFSKMSAESSINWVNSLLVDFWADQLTVRILTGLNSYYISYGNKPILFIELKVLIWRILP